MLLIDFVKFLILFIDRSISAKPGQYLDLLTILGVRPIALRLFIVHVIITNTCGKLACRDSNFDKSLVIEEGGDAGLTSRP